MSTKQIETRTGKLWLDERLGVIRFDYFPGSMVTRVEAEENLVAFVKLSEGKKFPFLCNITRCKSVDREARAFFAGRRSMDHYTALALFSDSPIGNMIANFYFSTYGRESLVPTKVFTSEATALEWLKGFPKE